MTFLAVAYGAVWLLVGLYVMFIGIRQRKLQTELEVLQEVVNEEAVKNQAA
jgi:CcmD family protein